LEHRKNADLATNLYRQHWYLTWNLNVSAFPGFSVIDDALKIPSPGSRPPNILRHHYVAATVSKQSEVDPAVVEVLAHFDAEPQKKLVLKDLKIQSVVPLFYALTMEANLRELVFDRFSPKNLGAIVNWVLINANRFFRVALHNYTEAVFAGLMNRRHSSNLVSSIAFRGCSGGFVQGFLATVKKATYSMGCNVFEKMKFSVDLANSFVRALDSFVFASNLHSLGFIDFQCEMPLLEFLKSVLKTAGSTSVCSFHC
jgi:hypothetical protein